MSLYDSACFFRAVFAVVETQEQSIIKIRREGIVDCIHTMETKYVITVCRCGFPHLSLKQMSRKLLHWYVDRSTCQIHESPGGTIERTSWQSFIVWTWKEIIRHKICNSAKKRKSSLAYSTCHMWQKQGGGGSECCEVKFATGHHFYLLYLKKGHIWEARLLLLSSLLL